MPKRPSTWPSGTRQKRNGKSFLKTSKYSLSNPSWRLLRNPRLEKGRCLCYLHICSLLLILVCHPAVVLEVIAFRPCKHRGTQPVNLIQGASDPFYRGSARAYVWIRSKRRRQIMFIHLYIQARLLSKSLALAQDLTQVPIVEHGREQRIRQWTYRCSKWLDLGNSLHLTPTDPTQVSPTRPHHRSTRLSSQLPHIILCQNSRT